MNKSKYTKEDLNWFAPHSANARMIESICDRSGIERDKALMSLKHYGNTSPATIPLSVDLAVKENKLRKGDLILLIGFGGGLAYASTLIRWTI